MTRELRRLLIPPQRLPQADGQPLVLGREESHYLQRVLRLRDGGRFAVIDGAGRLWTARLQLQARQALAQLEQPLARPLQQQARGLPRLALALALPRRDGEIVWRMACELGIDRLLPLQAERCAPTERFNHQRAAAIVREATEQCERLWLPELEPLQPATALLTSDSLTRGSGARLGLLATTRREGLADLATLLTEVGAGAAGNPGLQELVLAIGPEGGWTPQEEALALNHGWRAVTLGSTILRSSTAAVAGAVLLSQSRLSS